MADRDQNEIKYDARQLQEIEEHKKVRLIEKMKTRRDIGARGRCTAFCANLQICASSSSSARSGSREGKRSGGSRSLKRGGIKSSIAR